MLEAEKRYKNLAASEGLFSKKTIEAQKEVNKLRKRIDGINTPIKRFGNNVGNYPKQVGAAVGALKGLIGAFGIVEGLRLGLDFIKDAARLARETKGVQFAFKDLGNEGELAFRKIKDATKGTLSDLDIKKSLNEFKNFNISLEQTDVLFKFLAIRAAQTGKSVDSLRDSLVEGLAKESKLRIDNLGISVKDLNTELEKAPDFVSAVAEIAKREITEAGDILEDAASSQQRFNAAFENFKLSAGSGFIGRLIDDIYDLGTALLTTSEEVQKNDSFVKYLRELKKETNENIPISIRQGELTKKLNDLEQKAIDTKAELAKARRWDIGLKNEETKALELLLAKYEGQYEAVFKFKELLSDRFKEERKNNEEKLRTVALIEAEISKQQELLKEATKRSEAKVIQEKINLLEKELEAILGANGGRKKATESIKGSIKYYEELISKLKSQQQNLATNKEEWDSYQKQINDVNKTLEGLKENFKQIDTLFDKLDFSGIERSNNAFNKIRELLNEPQAIEGIDVDNALSDLDKWSDGFKEQQQELFNIQKEYAKKREDLERELGDNIKEIGYSIADALFQTELNRLDKQARINEEKAESALLFANGNAAAELQIKDQLAEKQGEIEEKRIKAEQKAFLFSQAFKAGEIAIDTIKAVAQLKAQAAILLANPLTAPLASLALGQIPLVIATGATAGAAVLAQSIPAFKDGVRDFDGGLAIVGDGGKSEIIRTPDGKTFKTPNTDTLVNLPKHSDVFSSEEDFMKDLRRLTDINNIMFDPQLFQLPEMTPSININAGGASARDIDAILGKHFNKHFSNLQTNQTIIDKNGIRTLISKGNSSTIIHNNRTSFKGISV